MVSLHTLRRVLAVDLRLSPSAISEVLAEFAEVGMKAAESVVFPLDEALDILCRAEAQVLGSAA